MSKQRNHSVMFPLVKEYLSSDNTQVAFCRSHGIKVHTFQYWLNKYKQEENSLKKESHKFIPVQLGKDQTEGLPHIRISYSNGLVIELPIY